MMLPDFSEQRRQLLEDRSLTGRAFCRAYSALVDKWLITLLGDEPGVSLVAVGGYGRGELAPGSDLDLTLVPSGRNDLGGLAQRIWYPIWDAGIMLDHSVRRVKEALAIGSRDLKTALGLLDARTVAGDPDAGAQLSLQMRSHWRDNRDRWLKALGDSVEDRHRRQGDVAFLLEPDLKEGRGGLRDVNALRAASCAASGIVGRVADLVNEAEEFLISVRVEAHRLSGRAGDQLLLQDQEGVAQSLDLPDADALMQRVSAAARTIGWTSDDAWRRIYAVVEGARGRRGAAETRLGPDILLRRGEVVVEPGAAVLDESLIFRVGVAAAQTGRPIERQTLELLRDGAPTPADPWQPRTLTSLLRLLEAGFGAIAAFEALDQFGLLVRMLPEWEPVRMKLQHNPYHRYTVDRHLMETAAYAAELVGGVSRPDLLLISSFLHDLGKGQPGDHSTAGAELMAGIAPRMGFSPEDVDILVRVVKDHLLLSDTATRRDIHDPSTITQAAARIKDQLTLELLAAISEADARATNESVWTSWRQGLVAELVSKISSALSGKAPAPKPETLDPSLQMLLDEAQEGLLVKSEGSRLYIVAPDRPGLFCQLAGVMTLQGLDVLAADAWSEPKVGQGMAVDVFEVHHARGGALDVNRLRQDLTKALDGRLALEARLAERANTYGALQSRRTRKPPTRSVQVDNEASEIATVVEVRAPDAVGVLYRITRAFVDLQLDIRHAKAQTLGHRVVDSFYLVDRRGEKLKDLDQIRELKRAVLFELSRLSA
jgi:[protein-PII] uridylyltransferase